MLCPWYILMIFFFVKLSLYYAIFSEWSIFGFIFLSRLLHKIWFFQRYPAYSVIILMANFFSKIYVKIENFLFKIILLTDSRSSNVISVLWGNSEIFQRYTDWLYLSLYGTHCGIMSQKIHFFSILLKKSKLKTQKVLYLIYFPLIFCLLHFCTLP